jgi:hypothetical protein
MSTLQWSGALSLDLPVMDDTHLRRLGYDVAMGVVSLPQALPADEIRGCASAACSTSPAHQPD